jgi:hypothetical protein
MCTLFTNGDVRATGPLIIVSLTRYQSRVFWRSVEAEAMTRGRREVIH